MNLSRCNSRRIVLTTFGSLGDLNPFIALARGLLARGYRPVIATSAYYEEHVRAAGIAFHPVRPDVDPGDKALIHRAMHPRRGTEVIIREILLPGLRDTYADLNAFLKNTDALITHSNSYVGHIIAEKRNLTWISVVLSPIAFLSAEDKPLLQGFPPAVLLEKLGPVANRYFFKAVKRVTRRWYWPVGRLRADIGLAPGRHPLFEGQHSPLLVLAMFSKVLARRRSDWPANTRTTGFAFYDAVEGNGILPDDLERFLNIGPPPLVFALGSAAVHTAGDFFREAAAAATALNRRAGMVVGKETNNLTAAGLLSTRMAVEYAPYSELFPNAAAIVHQGGIGTTGQALRSGKPTIVVPFAHDQPDNARRLERLGTSRTLPLRRCTHRTLTHVLENLLQDGCISDRAEEVGKIVRLEDGVGAACDAIGALL